MDGLVTMEEVRGKRMQLVRVMDIEKRRIPSKHYVRIKCLFFVYVIPTIFTSIACFK